MEDYIAYCTALHDIALYIVATVSQLIFVLRGINKYYELILVCYDFCFKIALKIYM